MIFSNTGSKFSHVDFLQFNLKCLAGVQSEIAAVRYEYWSSFAPLPVEVVLAAGQMAKDEDSIGLLR